MNSHSVTNTFDSQFTNFKFHFQFALFHQYSVDWFSIIDSNLHLLWVCFTTLFSRTWSQLHVLASSSDWFTVLFVSVVFHQSKNFGSTVNKNHSNNQKTISRNIKSEHLPLTEKKSTLKVKINGTHSAWKVSEIMGPQLERGVGGGGEGGGRRDGGKGNSQGGGT